MGGTPAVMVLFFFLLLDKDRLDCVSLAAIQPCLWIIETVKLIQTFYL